MTTAVAAAAVAALSASQAPGFTDSPKPDRTSEANTPDQQDPSVSGDSPYYTDLPPLHSPVPKPPTEHPPAGSPESGIPVTVLDAYKKAEAALAASQPGCHLPWELLAAIGKVESGHARQGRVDSEGTTLDPILGPVLDGNGFAKITDTDGGAYDGDTTHDRAVGPMQFIPSTWTQGGPDGHGWGADGNADGKKDPNNVYDAALAAGRYLCANGRDMAVEEDLHSAILGYNNSTDYLNTVLSWLEYYRKGTHEVPDGSGGLPGHRSDDSTPSSPPDPTPGGPGHSSPADPGKPGKPGGDGPSKPSDPSDPGKPPAGDPDSPQTPTDTVTQIEDAGSGALNATAGEAFADRVKVRTVTKDGDPVAKVRVRFTLVGSTDATFEGGESVATVQTSADGVATAPVLTAGAEAGSFTVRASVVGRALPTLDYKATVTARQADALVRTSDTPLVCAPGAQFADAVQVKAAYKGAPAAGVSATATLVTSETDPTPIGKGPYFKDGAGKPLRTLEGLATDENGLLTLPKLYADDTTGTFLLRITTEGGATLTVELTVEAPDTGTDAPDL